jgi:hypothetical protein
LAVETARRQDVEWPIRAKVASQLQAIIPPTDVVAVEEEEWGLCPPTLNLHQGKTEIPVPLEQNVGQRFHIRSLEEDRERDVATEDLFQSVHHSSGKQGMAAQVEEVIPNSNGVHVEDLLPDLRETSLQERIGCDIFMVQIGASP